MRAGGAPFGQQQLSLNFRIIPGTKFFAKLSPKESGAGKRAAFLPLSVCRKSYFFRETPSGVGFPL